jgi:hypothetical protein
MRLRWPAGKRRLRGTQARRSRPAFPTGSQDAARYGRSARNRSLYAERADRCDPPANFAIKVKVWDPWATHQGALEAAGVEFTHGDQPGVRLTKAAAVQAVKPARESNRSVAGKTAPTETTNSTVKKR